MNYDGYDTVINGEETYKETARVLLQDHAIIYPWTDERSTQLDILFTYQPQTCFEYGLSSHLQGGVRVSDLFVSIMRWGAFSFQLDDNSLSADYIAEKFCKDNVSPTMDKLAQLIEGVRKELILQQKS